MEKSSISKLKLIAGFILICISWFTIGDYNLYYTMFGAILLGIGFVIFLDGVNKIFIDKKNKIGLIGFAFSIISLCIFLVLYWSLETRYFWDAFEHSNLLSFSLIFISLISLAMALGIISNWKVKPKNMFGIIGFIITLINWLLVIILIIIPGLKPIY